MTTTPPTLADLAAFWVSHGGTNLGIVGNQKHCSGYHLGRDRIYGTCACKPDGTCEPGQGAKDYSVVMARDKAGLTNAASAIDLGRLNGSLTQLYEFSKWLVAQSQAGAAGYRDVREIIYSPDGVKVQRYSGVDGGIHTGDGNGDGSHTTHTHISYFRDSEKRDKRLLFAPYFAELPDTGEAMGPLKVTSVVPMTVDPIEGRQLLRADATPGPIVGNVGPQPSAYEVQYGGGAKARSIVAMDDGIVQLLFVRVTDCASIVPVPPGGDVKQPVELLLAGKSVYKGSV